MSDPTKDTYTTYGPAQERRTRTKVQFSHLPEDQQGHFQGPSMLDLLTNIPALMKGTPLEQLPNNGTITLDPTSKDFDLNLDTRHEAIHSLLMNAKGLQGIAQSSDLYSQIAQAVMQSRRGNMADEVPAYMGAYDPKQTSVPQDWRDEYIGKLQDTLAKINPQLAKTLGLLSQSPQGASQ
jgi:hypothetical protein